ncbi:ABC transporter permease [Mucilaginibacter limnophilus]|uniref:Transport permease protein n=1 Tax=Mucilaginibacter limnophilus TaxID=1932778 RepID=A0A3S2UM30_9SPHI|nr:ABC transporter permease [Mucilaginibacter limnophilus]RVU01629.1 ABC transporter permease [Mucilaginibacter limnophilus]
MSTSATARQNWDLEIKPRNSIFNLHFKEVWAYRDLLLLLVRRDFVSYYKQTLLGPVWFFVQPALTTLIYTFVFSRLAGISTDGIPPPLFYVAGITAWNYFADCLNKTSSVFRDNAHIFGKVYFPRLIMPLGIVLSSLIRFGVQMLLFLLMFGYYMFTGAHFSPTWYILLFPLLVIIMAFLGMGMGMMVSALTTRYRDLIFLVTFGVQLLMYGTTVIYPLSTALQRYPELARFIELNPMTPIIETFRYGFLGSGSFSWGGLLYCAAVSVIITIVGIIVFNRSERSFVDTV